MPDVNSPSARGPFSQLRKIAKGIRRRKFLMIGALLASIFFLVGFLISSQLPKVRSFILVKIEQLSRDELPVRILPGSIDVSLLPLGASLRDVKIAPKAELKDLIDPLSIDSLDLSISLWQLIQGKLRITEVSVAGSSLTVRIPLTESKGGSPLAGLFDHLSAIPIQKISLDRIALNLAFKKPRMTMNIGKLNLLVEKSRSAVALDFDAQAVTVRDAETNANVQIDLTASLEASRTTVVLSALKVRRGDSFVVASGTLGGDTEALKFNRNQIKARTELNLESLRDWAVSTFDSLKKVPKLKGRAFLEASVNGDTDPNVDFQFRTEGLQIDKIVLGKIATDGAFAHNLVNLPKVTIDNPGGHYDISQIRFHTTEKMDFQGLLKTSQLQLYDALKTFGVNDAALWLQVAGEFPCSGQFKPKFGVTCKGHLQGRDLTLKDSVHDKGVIIAGKGMDANGEFTVDEDKVSYKADLTMPHSRGRSNGSIGYETGFKIDYEADELAVSDIQSLAGLKLEGVARIKGSTQGTSHTATLNMDIAASNMWFEDYWLGDPKASVSYKQGNLDFKNLQGHLSVSRYAGDVRVDLRKKQITVDGRVPFFNSEDLLKAFSRKFTLPVSLTGTGQANIHVNGPFEFTALSYDLKSSLFRGAVAGEPFDQVRFDVKAKSGEVISERVVLNKGPSTITLTGVGHPDGTIRAVILGRGWHLEETNFVTSSGLSLTGMADFDMHLEGPVLLPDATLTGQITKTSIAEQGLADSSFRVKLSKRTISGQGDLLGETVRTEFVLPLDDNAPFSFKSNTENWNYAPLFAAVSGPGGRKDFEGRLTSSINISSATGGFWNSTGEASIQKFSLARGPVALAAAQPIVVQFKNGQVIAKSFELAGDSTFVKVTNSPTQKSKLDLQINGKVDLSLFAMLTPFFEELRGAFSFAFNLRAGPGTADVLGSAYVEKGYLKFFEFPHALEDINMDVLFNQKRLLFNSIRASLGGGRINASGSMELKGHHDYPVNVNGTFEKISLNIPDKVKTTGDGHFSLTGNWFPFLLKGEYDIQHGMMTKEFGGDGPASDGIRRSYFLPEFLLKENFSPLLVDLRVDFNQGIDVKNPLLEGKILGALNVKGAPGKPSIAGTVTTDKQAKLTFRDNAFDIISSNVQFDGSTELNPKIYVAATSHVQDYDINLVVQGRANKPSFIWTSSPALPEKDIISLLALGVTDTKLVDGSVSTQQQQASSSMQAGSGILSNNPLGQEIKDRFGVNLQFSSGFDPSTNSAVQKIVVSRQISKKMDVSATQAIGRANETEAKVRYRLSDKMSLIGSWLGRQAEDVTNDDSTSVIEKSLSRFGLDVEYKFEFK